MNVLAQSEKRRRRLNVELKQQKEHKVRISLQIDSIKLKPNEENAIDFIVNVISSCNTRAKWNLSKRRKKHENSVKYVYKGKIERKISEKCVKFSCAPLSIQPNKAESEKAQMLNYLNRDKLYLLYICIFRKCERKFFSKWPRERYFALVQIHFSDSLLKFNDMENYAIRQIELRFFERPTRTRTLTYKNAWILECFGVCLVFFSQNLLVKCVKKNEEYIL